MRSSNYSPAVLLVKVRVFSYASSQLTKVLVFNHFFEPFCICTFTLRGVALIQVFTTVGSLVASLFSGQSPRWTKYILWLSRVKKIFFSQEHLRVLLYKPSKPSCRSRQESDCTVQHSSSSSRSVCRQCLRLPPPGDDLAKMCTQSHFHSSSRKTKV